MILGIGTDLAHIDRIAALLTARGAQFTARCFAPEEREYVENKAKNDPAARAAGYARRWAAKEACAKALGCGIRDGVYLKDIVVLNDAQGAPRLDLRAGAKERLTALMPRGMTAVLHLTLADDAPMALAFVVISAVSTPAPDSIKTPGQ